MRILIALALLLTVPVVADAGGFRGRLLLVPEIVEQDYYSYTQRPLTPNADHVHIFNGTGSGRVLYVTRVVISGADNVGAVGSAHYFHLGRITAPGVQCLPLSVQRIDRRDAAEIPSQIVVATECVTPPARDSVWTIVTCAFPGPECLPEGDVEIPLYEGEGLTLRQTGYTTAAKQIGITLFYRIGLP